MNARPTQVKISVQKILQVRARSRDKLVTNTKQESRVFSRFALFPLLMVLMAVSLGGMNLNGSSIAELSLGVGYTEQDAGVLAGTTRWLRADEYKVRTPWLIRQIETGFPSTQESAVGEHQVGLIYDIPTWSPSALVRPHHIPYLLLQTQRAISVEWWLMIALQAIGIYLLVLSVTRRPGLAAAAGLLVAMSPASHWWTIPQSWTTIGYGSAAAGFFLFAVESRRPIVTLYLTVAFGVSAAAFTATLYPPWQIPIALGLVAITLSLLTSIAGNTADHQLLIMRVAYVLVFGVVVAAALVLLHFLHVSDAVRAIQATAYPGSRRSQSGGFEVWRLLVGPYDFLSSSRPTALVNGRNQSGNAIGIFYLLPVSLTVLAVVSGRFDWRSRELMALTATLACGGLLVMWAVVPLPQLFGSITGLNFATTKRLPLPISFLSVLSLVFLIAYLQRVGKQLSRSQALLVFIFFFGSQLAASNFVSLDDTAIGLRRAVLYSLPFVIGFSLAITRFWRTGLVLLLLLTGWQSARINPIQNGLGNLHEGSFASIVQEELLESPESVWIDTTVWAARAVLIMSGANSLSGISPYPDRTAWESIDPEGISEEFWNRYAHLYWTHDSSLNSAQFELLSADALAIKVNFCSKDFYGSSRLIVVMAEGASLECGRRINSSDLGDFKLELWERR